MEHHEAESVRQDRPVSHADDVSGDMEGSRNHRGDDQIPSLPIEIRTHFLPTPNKHKSFSPCPLWMHHFKLVMGTSLRDNTMLCYSCGWTLAEVIVDVEKGGKCMIGGCPNDRHSGTGVCVDHGAVVR